MLHRSSVTSRLHRSAAGRLHTHRSPISSCQGAVFQGGSAVSRRGSWLRLVYCVATVLLVAGSLGASAAASADDDLESQRSKLDPTLAELSFRERLNLLVQRVKLEQSHVTTMSARFRQEKTSEMLLEPSTDLGLFYYRAPDQVRWEYHEPEEMLVVINGEELVTFYKEQGVAESASIGDISEKVFKYLGASGSLDKLAEFFEVTAYFPEGEGDPYHLVLEPRYSRIERRLLGMEIWIDPVSYQPTQFKYLQPGGDETTYSFEDIKLNEPLSDVLFEVELPEGVAVKTIDLKKR